MVTTVISPMKLVLATRFGSITNPHSSRKMESVFIVTAHDAVYHDAVYHDEADCRDLVQVMHTQAHVTLLSLRLSCQPSYFQLERQERGFG